MSNKTILFLTRLAQTVVNTVKTERKNVVKETITLASGASKSYNLATLLGSAASAYDFARTEVRVRVKDTDATSATNGFFIGAEAVAVTGTKTTGEVKIVNLYEASAEFQVTIDVPRQ